MMTLEDISNKLDAALNGTDAETAGIAKPAALAGYLFMVATEGFHFGKAYDMPSGKNLIPVYVGSLGGDYNPVADLGEADYSMNVSVYFPIRFKNDFYQLQSFLISCFVGQIRTFGSDKARCNITPAQYGEIQSINSKQFSQDSQQLGQWIDATYKVALDVNEMWMSMTFTLYLSTAKGLGRHDGFMMGDQCRITSLKYTDCLGASATESDPTFVQTTDNVNGEPAAQQILGERQTKGFAASSQYTFTLPLYVKDKAFYRSVISDWKNRSLQGSTLEVTESISFTDSSNAADPVTAVSAYYIISAALVKEKGSLLVLAFALADRL